MNEPSSNAGGVGGLGDNGPADPAHQDVRDSFGANPAATGGSGAQDPNTRTASLRNSTPPQQDAVPAGEEATMVQPAVPAGQPAQAPQPQQPRSPDPDENRKTW